MKKALNSAKARKIKSHILHCIMLITIILLDQASKIYVLEKVYYMEQINSLLNIVRVWNKGVSFGLFSGMYSNEIFIVAVVIISLWITYFFIKTSVQIMKIAYICILGGALGNLIDRIKYGAVFDFIDLHIRGLHWPAFNIADSSICLGGAILVCNMIFNKKLACYGK